MSFCQLQQNYIADSFPIWAWVCSSPKLQGQVLQKTIDESIGADDLLHQRSQYIISQNQLVLNSEEVSYKIEYLDGDDRQGQ